MMNGIALVLTLMVAGGASLLVMLGKELPPEPDCVDALVTAQAIEQTPTAYPDCGDCFVLTWPWIVELDVNRVLKGQAPTGRVTVLTFQHMEEPTDRDTRWGLRRNSLGVFNEVHLAPGAVLPVCAADAPPVEPVIRPANGQTLDDLRNELGG